MKNLSCPIKKCLQSRRERGHQSRERLLAAALHCFSEHGYAGTSTRSIAQLAEQNIAAIPYYFGGKEGLFLEAIRAGMEHLAHPPEVYARVEALLAAESVSREQLEEAIVGWVSAATLRLGQEVPEATQCVRMLMREQYMADEALKEKMHQLFEPMCNPFIRLVARFMGRDGGDPQAALFAHTLMGGYLAFRLAPEAVLHQTGWKKIGPDEAEAIERLVRMQTMAALEGWRAASHEGVAHG